MKTTLLLPASLVVVIAAATGCTITTDPSSSPGSTTSPDGATDPASPSSSGGGTSNCSFGEPNDTRDLATPVELGTDYTGLCLTGDDHDWYQFTAPADAAGGYVKVVLSNVRGASVGVKAYAQATHREVANTYSATSGESLTTFFSVAPGAKYNIDVSEFSWAAAATHDMVITYARFDDSFEPNDTRDAAKTIISGSPVQAHLVALAGPDVPKPSDPNDWYKVDLRAGRASIQIENVPTDVGVEYEIVNAGGTSVDAAYRATRGESLIRPEVEIPSAGTYYVRVGAFYSVDSDGKGDVVPDSFTRRYSLTVTSH